MSGPDDAARIVRRFLAAVEARNLPEARAMMAPDCRMQFPGAAPMTSLDAVVQWAAPRYRHVRKTIEDCEVTSGADPDGVAVYCRGTLSGAWPDGTPFEGIRFIDRFELKDGRIIRQDVWNDIAEKRAEAGNAR